MKAAILKMILQSVSMLKIIIPLIIFLFMTNTSQACTGDKSDCMLPPVDSSFPPRSPNVL